MDANVMQHDIENFISNTPAEEGAPQAVAAPASLLKLTIERGLLMKALGHVQSVVEKRTTIPVLANVKLEGTAGILSLTATDMELAVTEKIAADISTAGALTVSAHTFYDIVRKLPDDAQVSLEATAESTLVIRASNCKFSLATLPAEDFPVMDDSGLTHHFTLPVAECAALIEKTRFAISTEETRYYLNGIYLHAAQNADLPVLRAVATDGHRLARVEVELPEGAAGIPGVIIPRKAVLEVKKIAEEGNEVIAISLSATKIRFTCGNAVLTSKLIDGTFPDYEKVIPTSNDKLMEANRDVLAKAVDRVSTISSEKSRAIRVALQPGKLSLSATGEANGTAREEVEVQYGANEMEIGFNSRYLLEMLGGIEGETVQFVFADSSAPALVRDASDMRVLYVIMPMRV